MPRKKSFVDNQFEGHPLCDVPREFSYNYIRTIVDLVNTMTERHSKVLVARFDLRYPQGYEADGTNRNFSAAMQAVCRDFSQKKYDPQYVAKREQQSSCNPHYHVGLAHLKNIGRNSCKFHYRKYRKKLWFIPATERRMVRTVPTAG